MTQDATERPLRQLGEEAKVDGVWARNTRVPIRLRKSDRKAIVRVLVTTEVAGVDEAGSGIAFVLTAQAGAVTATTILEFSFMDDAWECAYSGRCDKFEDAKAEAQKRLVNVVERVLQARVDSGVSVAQSLYNVPFGRSDWREGDFLE